jgi:hypothetical protein
MWETVKELVLIAFSVGALLIALYCLFFMVPVKRFWEKMEALGGGLKGIEGYVDEVHTEICQKLSEMETAVRHQIGQAQEETQEAVEKASDDGKQARKELERLRADLQSLQAELRGAARDSTRVTQSVDALTKRLAGLQEDFNSLDVKLRESVRQLVAESFKSVEATVLNALDTLRDEMLGEPHRSSASPTSPASNPFRRSQRPKPPNGGNGGPANGSKVIVAPLFGRDDHAATPEPQKVDEEHGTEEQTEPDPHAGGGETGDGADGRQD